MSDATAMQPWQQAEAAIAHILGTLDDKIELNRRMNETLEAIARALFKSWFMDFDPVRRNMVCKERGQPSPQPDGHPSPTGRGDADEDMVESHAFDHLFPDRFQDSELGEIPKGWETGTLADVSTLNPEVWSKDNRPDSINYVDLSNTKWGRIESVTVYSQYDAPSRAQRVLSAGDTIVGTVRPGNGSYTLVAEDGLTGSTGFAVLRPRSRQYQEFVYLAATTAENIETLAHLADGAAYPAVRPEVVIATQTVRPDDQVLALFSAVAGPLLAKMAQNERESRTLAALRDTLLPKLISGELQIKAADKMVGGSMTLSQEWRALQQEAQFTAEQVATGVTVLGRANHVQAGLYLQAFFGISTGLERMGKLIIVAEHAIQNIGGFPTDRDLRRIGHDLRKLLPKCAAIGRTINPERAYASSRPADSIHQGIEETLSEFATKSRYYNLDYIAGAARQQADPITMWWEHVAQPICERHYSEPQRRKDAAKAAVMAKAFGNHASVLQYAEDGTEINDVGIFFARAGVTAVVQKYGRFYTLQIIRWLASLLSELSHYGAYQKRIEPLLGLNEPFTIFVNDDQYFLNRRTWSIYRP